MNDMSSTEFRALGPYWLCSECKSTNNGEDSDTSNQSDEEENFQPPPPPSSTVRGVIAPARLVREESDDRMDWDVTYDAEATQIRLRSAGGVRKFHDSGLLNSIYPVDQEM